MEIVDVKTHGGLRAARRQGAVYCGKGSPLGNPYRIGKDGNQGGELVSHGMRLRDPN
jgi:hypothetical protein